MKKAYNPLEGKNNPTISNTNPSKNLLTSSRMTQSTQRTKKQGASAIIDEDIKTVKEVKKRIQQDHQDIQVSCWPEDLIADPFKENKKADIQSNTLTQSKLLDSIKQIDIKDSESSILQKSLRQSEDSYVSEDDQYKNIQKDKKIVKVDVTKPINLDEEVFVTLTETETKTIFSYESLAVGLDMSDYDTIKKKNDVQSKICENKRGSDLFSAKESQTLNNALKFKKIGTDEIITKDIALNATVQDIQDSSNKDKQSNEEIIALKCTNELDKLIQHYVNLPGVLLPEEGDQKQSNVNIKKGKKKQDSKDSSVTASKIKSSRTNLNTSSRSITTEQSKLSESKIIGKQDENVKFELPESLLKHIKTIERLLNQNKYHEQQILYKDYPTSDLSDIIGRMKDNENKIESDNFKILTMNDPYITYHDTSGKRDQYLLSLFNQECEESNNRCVSSLCFNEVNPDLLAASYGEYDQTSNLGGYVMFWTLKNPTFPERIIRTHSSVISCSFSKRNPNLIAIGCQDGTVSIYDVRSDNDSPIVTSKEMQGKHTDTVWEVKWIDREDKGEPLISISTDGQIKEWNIKKGLEQTDLMIMKRMANPSQKHDQKEGLIFRQASGFSIDFPKDEKNNQYAATEDGTIHRCSVSYSEQYLDSYFGHTGPIQKVRCSPQLSKVFLTCSNDQTVKMWEQTEKDPILDFKSTDLYSSVNDVAWSPHKSTVFVNSCNDGRIEVRDLEIDPQKALIKYQDRLDNTDTLVADNVPENEEVFKKTWPASSCVIFSKTSPVLVSGNTKGCVSVYRCIGLDPEQLIDPGEQQQKLLNVMKSNKHEEKK